VPRVPQVRRLEPPVRLGAGKGWWQFGTRRRLFDAADPEFGCAIELFRAKYADGVEKVIRDDLHFRGAQEVVCYCEFLGPHSFAGVHDPATVNAH
jgi:hypothetical protein